MLSLFLGLTLAMATNGSISTEVSHDASTQTPDQNYTLAYKKSVEEDKPLMVVVGAPWCPACETLKKTTIANMQNSGELDDVSVALVDRDAEPELAKSLMQDEKMIPQIIMFSKTEDGRWSRRKLMGYQPVQPVRSLIKRVVSLGQG
ncbi:thioredoxin family protein [Rhodopirellula sp. JC740]|uniref:Thioredoxin family protein n=1 Tax=Rhodopirellula halodulae TaxID=2894198 RepID=A0ABS8NG87_9BACT|nr:MULTISPECIES: thioredoxin family protein [unclassified Rhodopirellula]MCC9641962.1 thioredoxin family protein [Rhodopirellula sp. JC740]MCC9658431.1 thioredoxin family protein [Rhodopirellula sp. JC737]